MITRDIVAAIISLFMAIWDAEWKDYPDETAASSLSDRVVVVVTVSCHSQLSQPVVHVSCHSQLIDMEWSQSALCMLSVTVELARLS